MWSFLSTPVTLPLKAKTKHIFSFFSHTVLSLFSHAISSLLQTRLHVAHGLLSQLTVLVLSQLGGYQIWCLSNQFRNFVANRSCG